MPKFDVTKLNVAVDRALDSTVNPRHRFMLQAFSRHRYLEIAGRYDEILAPDMMAMDPVYHFHIHIGGNDVVLRGHAQLRNLYRMWAETNQTFLIDSEEIAVADHFIASVALCYQQLSGNVLKARKALSYLPSILSGKTLKTLVSQTGHETLEDDMYLYKSVGQQMICAYDDRGRLRGKDVWEPDPSKAELIKLDPADVLTTENCAKFLEPLIQPLPSFDELVLRRRAGPAN
jgi:hypothetical protein